MIIVLLCILALFTPFSVAAKYDPLSVPNNTFGIHIVDVNDMADAATLVNSTGGDWGYVTLVIQEDDRNVEKWQRVFDEMRRLHLIPIVRLATHVEGTAWKIPSKESGEDWARFLNSLNWPIENRYVLLFNEPNHANEWGGQIDPEGFADIIQLFTDTLHDASEDFFVLPGSLDVSAASDGKSLDAQVYWSRMISHTPTVFDDIDGWSSHSYPNPGFSGSPYATGRGTLYSYRWELDLIQKRLPVFITETGWVHRNGVTYNAGLLSSEEVGNNLIIAAQNAWDDPSIIAVTPFVLNYQAYPFDHFSWRVLNSHEFYSQFFFYQGIEKMAGTPQQREHFTLKNRLIPHTLVTDSSYTLTDTLTNNGQSILSIQNGYYLHFSAQGIFKNVNDPLPILEPKQSGTVTIHLETPTTASSSPYSLELMHGNQVTTIESGVVTLVLPPSVHVTSILGWRSANNTNDATVLIYDDKTLIYKFNGVRLAYGKATITGLRNVVPGKAYRVVLLVPYYLPRQKITTLSASTTQVAFARMYPLDFNLDGTFSLSDVIAAIKLKPNFLFSLFIGP